MNTGYAIFVSTLVEGYVPLVRDERDRAVVFATERDAQLEIADNLMTRLREFLDDERDFESAATVEEFVVKVQVLPDGSLEDECGRRFY